METAWEILALCLFWGLYVLAAIGVLIILFAVGVGIARSIHQLFGVKRQ